MADLDLFEKVLKAFYQRPGKEYGLNQIANLVLGKGDPKNAATIGRALNQLYKYFRTSGFGKAVKWSPNWTRIEKEHPEIFQRLKGKEREQKPASGFNNYQEMLEALNEEKRAIREELKRYPIKIINGTRAHELEEPGDIIYNLFYFTDLEEGYFPIPDGAPVRLLYRNYPPINGTLLSNDGLKSIAIVLLEYPIPTNLYEGILEPRLEELIETVSESIERASQEKEGNHNLLLNQELIPSPVSLVEFSSDFLDESQKRAATIACGSDITLLWGPPGTGKTYTLGEAIAHWIRIGKRVLAVSIANVAVDQICLKTRDALQRHGMMKLLDQGKILRLGYARDLEVVKDRRFFPDKEKAQAIRKELEHWMSLLRKERSLGPNEKAEINLNMKKLHDQLRKITQDYIANSMAIFTTIIQTCMNSVAFLNPSFDVVVVDEASMVSIPYLIAAASVAKKQVLIAGDFRQLGPIALSQTEKSHKWLRKDIFEKLNLTETNISASSIFPMVCKQRRMHPDISRCVNEIFYAGRLEDFPPDNVKISSLLEPFPGKGAVLVEVTPNEDCGVEQTESGSRLNRGTAKISVKLALKYSLKNSNLQIAIITPYRAQCRLIQKMMKEECQDKRILDKISVGTVHTFQGSERDVVIIDIVEMRNFRIGRLFRGRDGDRLANVAITRAKGKLVLICDPEAFISAPGYEAVRQIRSIISSYFRETRIPWKRLENRFVN
jgi:hypothetical protein